VADVGAACSTYGRGEKFIQKFWSGILKRSLERLRRVYRRIVLSGILRHCGVRACIGFIWLKVEFSGRLF